MRCNLAVVLLLLVSACARTREASARDADQLLSNIRARVDALGRDDLAAWARYVADDMLTPFEGAVPSKQALLEQRKAWPKAVRYYYGPLEQVKVRFHGDTAVVTYRARQYNEIGGQTTYVQSWQIETHVRSGDGWMLVGVADAPIPFEPTVATLDPRIYDAYVGDYEYAPGMIAAVRRVGDRLVHQMPGLGDDELVPETDTSFFIRGEAAGGSSSRTIFVKDDAGRVTHYIYRQYGATDRTVRKIR
jgi:hypothetical protein